MNSPQRAKRAARDKMLCKVSAPLHCGLHHGEMLTEASGLIKFGTENSSKLGKRDGWRTVS